MRMCQRKPISDKPGARGSAKTVLVRDLELDDTGRTRILCICCQDEARQHPTHNLRDPRSPVCS